MRISRALLVGIGVLSACQARDPVVSPAESPEWENPTESVDPLAPQFLDPGAHIVNVDVGVGTSGLEYTVAGQPRVAAADLEDMLTRVLRDRGEDLRFLARYPEGAPRSWRAELFDAITAARAAVFPVSPDSVDDASVVHVICKTRGQLVERELVGHEYSWRFRGREILDADELQRVVGAALSERGAASEFVIAPAPGVTCGDVARTIDLVRGVGVKNLRFGGEMNPRNAPSDR